MKKRNEIKGLVTHNNLHHKLQALLKNNSKHSKNVGVTLPEISLVLA